MMKKILYLILGLIGVLSVKAQPDCFFTHYSSEDGLSQNTVMSILQDRKGNIWLATWDGINKFNGYSFKTYKARLDNRIVLSHNRIDHMLEDKYGFGYKPMTITPIASIPVRKRLSVRRVMMKRGAQPI